VSAYDLAEAYRRLTTGDENPPRPWAYMSHVGKVTDVTEVAALNIQASRVDMAAFGFAVDGVRYQLEVKRL